MSILDTLITDRTLADVQNGSARGGYDYTDLNRVGAAQVYVRDLLATVGANNVAVRGKTNWTMNDIQRRSDMDRYLADMAALKACIPNTKPLPTSIRFLDYIGANQIEAMLAYLAEAVAEIKKIYLPAGTTFAVSGAAALRFEN